MYVIKPMTRIRSDYIFLEISRLLLCILLTDGLAAHPVNFILSCRIVFHSNGTKRVTFTKLKQNVTTHTTLILPSLHAHHGRILIAILSIVLPNVTIELRSLEENPAL